MKSLEFALVAVCVLVASRAIAMTTATGCGDLVYNNQIIAHYSVDPGSKLDSDVNFVDTECPSTSPINQEASCDYYQMHNPSINMNCP